MPVSNKFYNIFWNNLQCQNIFLLHKEQLLEKGEIKLKTASKHFYFPRIVLSNSLKRKEAFQRIEQRIKDRNIETDHTLTAIGVKNLNEERITKYFTEKFGQSIELISQKLNGGNFSQIAFVSEIGRALFSEKRLLALLHKYNFVPKEVSTFDTLKRYFEGFVDNEVSNILNSDHFIDMYESFDQLANYYNNYIFNSLIDANKFYTDVLYDKENFKSKLELFDSLYEAGTLIGGSYKTYYECVNCNVGTFSGNMTLNVIPSKVKLKCPNCNKEVFYLAPFKINDTIFKDITSKDGLIHSAVKQLLDSFKILNATNVNLGKDIELDFEIINKEKMITHIVETKMFKTDRTEDVIVTNLREGLRKFITTRQKLISINQNYVNVQFQYLTNIADDRLILNAFESFRNELQGARFSIHTPHAFKKIVDELSLNYK